MSIFYHLFLYQIMTLSHKDCMQILTAKILWVVSIHCMYSNDMVAEQKIKKLK